MSYTPEVHWGDGSDGDVTITADTDLNGTVKQYNNLTINTGYKLYDSTGFLKIFVRGTLTINGTIDQSGLGAAGGSAGTPATYKCNDFFNGNAVAGGSPISLINATGYGSGGAKSAINAALASGGAGSAPGAPTTGEIVNTDISGYLSLFNPLDTTHPGALTVKAGAGGGGGGAGDAWTTTVYNASDYDAGAAGGAGGAGGGFVIIFARFITGSGSIKCDGVDGSAGVNNWNTSNSSGGAGGGGGGGSGGYIHLICRNDGSISTSVMYGAGGAAAWRDDFGSGESIDAWSSAGSQGMSGTVVKEYVI